MHNESLTQAIKQYIFDDDDMYRRHFIPCQKYMTQNPRQHDRVRELVDNVCMKFSKVNKIPYSMITPDVKNEVTIEIYQEMINDETYRSRR